MSTFLKLNEPALLLETEVLDSDTVSPPTLVFPSCVAGADWEVTPGSMKNNIALFCLFIPGGVKDNEDPPARSPLAISRLPETPEGPLTTRPGCLGFIILTPLDLELELELREVVTVLTEDVSEVIAAPSPVLESTNSTTSVTTEPSSLIVVLVRGIIGSPGAAIISSVTVVMISSTCSLGCVGVDDPVFKNTKSNPGFEFEMPLELNEEEDDDNEEDNDSVFNDDTLPTFLSCAETILPDVVSLVTPLASNVKDVSTVRKSLAF